MSNRSWDLRQTLHSAFSFVRSQEANQATAAITLDQLMDEQIRFLKQGETRPIVDNGGSDAGSRISRYDRLTNLRDGMQAVVDAVENAQNDSAVLLSLGVLDDS